ncbi:MAG: electron transfer flavoprotein subunit alpha/FixB family protein [Clostridia bacterium]|nr:electron transfer flavoprotein subunit alpha/FixB family protein [Clostridia bacterium]
MRITDEKEKLEFKNIWTVSEFSGGALQPVSLELLGIGRQLADARQCELCAILFGSNTGESADLLIAHGADRVIVVDDPRLDAFNDELECNILERLVKKYKPETVLGPATHRGRALMPRLAGKLYTGLTADCTNLSIDPDNGDLLQTRPAFGGNIIATIRCSNHRPQMATLRPHVMRSLEPDPTRRGSVKEEKIADSDLRGIKKVVRAISISGETVNIGDARIIVSGGRGVKGPEGFKLLEKLANLLGGAVGASRAAVDSGWIDFPHQIGQTGQTVQADLYIACGISGQIQHLAGMQSCKTIVAIDTNESTPMMEMADISIKGDLFEIIPRIIDELKDFTL